MLEPTPLENGQQNAQTRTAKRYLTAVYNPAECYSMYQVVKLKCKYKSSQWMDNGEQPQYQHCASADKGQIALDLGHEEALKSAPFLTQEDDCTVLRTVPIFANAQPENYTTSSETGVQECTPNTNINTDYQCKYCKHKNRKDKFKVTVSVQPVKHGHHQQQQQQDQNNYHNYHMHQHHRHHDAQQYASNRPQNEVLATAHDNAPAIVRRVLNRAFGRHVADKRDFQDLSTGACKVVVKIGGATNGAKKSKQAHKRAYKMCDENCAQDQQQQQQQAVRRVAASGALKPHRKVKVKVKANKISCKVKYSRGYGAEAGGARQRARDEGVSAFLRDDVQRILKMMSKFNTRLTRVQHIVSVSFFMRSLYDSQVISPLGNSFIGAETSDCDALSQISASTQDRSQRQIVFSIIIFRHGAREALLTDSSGPLTDAGKVQEYLLGREFGARYKQSLLSAKFDTREVHIQTSPSERAIQSAKWFLAGLYPRDEDAGDAHQSVTVSGVTRECLPPNALTPGTVPHSAGPLQIVQASDSIPHILKSSESMKRDFFYHAYTVCPNVLRHIDAAHASPEYVCLQAKYRDVWQQVVQHFADGKLLARAHGYDDPHAPPDLKKLSKYLDFYRAYQANGVAEKEQAINNFPQELVTRMKEAKMEYIELKFGNDFVKKAVVTRHFHDMLQHIRAKFDASRPQSCSGAAPSHENAAQDLKMVLYSCHDRNIFLTLFNLCYPHQFRGIGDEGHFQPFASNLNFEFVQDVGEQCAAAEGDAPPRVYVRLIYNDNVVPVQTSDESGYSRLDDFVRLLESKIDHSLLDVYAQK